jgi:hypothetical protein
MIKGYFKFAAVSTYNLKRIIIGSLLLTLVLTALVAYLKLMASL